MKIFSTNNFHNAIKHLKIFSFLKNSIFGKYLFSGKYFTGTKHSHRCQYLVLLGWIYMSLPLYSSMFPQSHLVMWNDMKHIRKSKITGCVLPLFFFFLRVNSNLTWVYCQETKITVHALFITVHNIVHALKNIKNGSHDTIHTFKNYFAIVLSVFSFSNNKFNSNGPSIVYVICVYMPFFFNFGGLRGLVILSA